ncbi:hypothetical protein Gotur_006248, partial [Gossypium turneri]
MFGKVDLVPTIEEYMALLCCSKFQADRVYSRAVNVPTFSKKLMSVTGMSEQWVVIRIKQKGDSKCVPWRGLKDAILTHPDATPILVILAETFTSLSAYRKTGEGRFIGCTQLLLAWFHSHFWKVDKVSYRVFSENYSPLKEIVTTPRRDDISKEKWIAILQNLREEDIEWRAPWLLPDEILYRCGSFDWVPLLGVWGATGYAPLLVLRQYRSRQFIPATQGIADCEFSYKDDGYRKKIQEMASARKQTRRMKRL